MEIKVDTEKTIAQIGMQMWDIVGRISDRCCANIVIFGAFNADALLRDEVVQKLFLRYERLISLIESVKPLDADNMKHKTIFFAKASKEPAEKLFRRLLCRLSEAEITGQMLSACYEFVPLIVHRMRVEGIIKEGGENEKS